MFVSTLPASGQTSASSIEQKDGDVLLLVHVLDYLAQDYPEAVSEGRVVNLSEYNEMISFGGSAEALVEALTNEGKLSASDGLNTLVDGLQSSIDAKAPLETVSSQAKQIRDIVLAATGVQVVPRKWPSIAAGRQLFEQSCAVCHGVNGDGNGRVAPSLDPRPTNFMDGDRTAQQSPFQVYNTVRMGVEGTAMPEFQLLSEEEAWDVAFFVKSLRHGAAMADTLQAVASRGEVLPVDLSEVATLNDSELAARLAEQGIGDASAAVAALRVKMPAVRASTGLHAARELLDRALASYRDGDFGLARRSALSAYLDGVEPVEPSIAARDRSLAIRIEEQMLAVRHAIERREGVRLVGEAVNNASVSLDQADRVLAGTDGSPWFSFFVAASILLREGLEALLIIVAILGVLRSIQQTRAARWVHVGWISAVALGMAAWVFSDSLMQLGAAQREIMEGGVALLAVGVLLYVGFWLHSKSEIHRWKEFIDERVKRSLGAGNLLGLAGIAFFAVFREAFESVLFLSALTLEQGTGHKYMVAGGAIAAIAVVLVVAALLLRYSVRLPIRSLFRYSSTVMGVLCIILVGKGIHAFQEAGFLSTTSVPSPLRIGLIGIYPTIETLAAQFILVSVVITLWMLPRRMSVRLT